MTELVNAASEMGWKNASDLRSSNPGRDVQKVGTANFLGEDVQKIHDPVWAVLGNLGDSQCYLGVQAKVAARSNAATSWCLSARLITSSRERARSVQKDRRTVAPGGTRTRWRMLKIGSSTVPTVFERGRPPLMAMGERTPFGGNRDGVLALQEFRGHRIRACR